MTRATLQQLFEYDDWANTRVWRMLRDAANDPARERRLLAHILAAQDVWMTRLRGNDSSGIDPFPDQTLAQCRASIDHNRDSYGVFIGAIDENGLDQPVQYLNTRNQSFSTPIREILIHVANHGSYHRGQIALARREANHTPVNTDFITFTRR